VKAPKVEGFPRFGRGSLLRSVADMAYINASRITAARPEEARQAHVDEVRSDRARAGIALSVAWAAIAITFGAYAIAQRSVGAFLIGLAVIAVLRTAWKAAWGDEQTPERDAQRDISFLP
jgi:hypothetical protein